MGLRKEVLPVVQSEPILVDVKTAARMLGTTVWCIRTLVWRKKLPRTVLGNRLLFRPEDLRAFAADRVGKVA